MTAELRLQCVHQLQFKYDGIAPYLNERSRRIWVAIEAKSHGWGGVTIVRKATGMDYKTISKGGRELLEKPIDSHRIRRLGGGRKRKEDKNPEIIKAINKMVDPVTRGDPESPLLWIAKSTYNIADEISQKVVEISQRAIYRILKDLGYSMQANQKIREGKNHPDRDGQFRHIYNKVNRFLKESNPIISVDTKKKENIGNYKNNGLEYEQKGKPCQVNTHDFVDKNLGKVAPYGVYDIGKNKGWVSVGISKDTAEFAVNSIRTWWRVMGKDKYKKSKQLMITADCGGSNGNRVRLWKRELQRFANEINRNICVSHFPPGTSKWNKIEHRMFSYISKNWRGRPLITRETVVNLIGNTKTKTGLKIRAALDYNEYNTGIKISDEELASINIKTDAFHGEWNYTIYPQNNQ